MWAQGFWAEGLWADGFWEGGQAPSSCLSLADAQAFLLAIGVRLPDQVVQAYIDLICTINACLTAHYPPNVALLIKLNLLGLMVIASGDKYVSSETAPSGASRSYRFKTDELKYRGMLSTLRLLDTFGCTTGLIPADPFRKAFAGLWIGRGRCKGGC